VKEAMKTELDAEDLLRRLGLAIKRITELEAQLEIGDRVLAEQDANDQAEQPAPKCTCGYDARNNERDLDVNCSVHMATRPPQLFTDKTDEYDMRDKPAQPPEKGHGMAEKEWRNEWMYIHCVCGCTIGPFHNEELAEDAFDCHASGKDCLIGEPSTQPPYLRERHRMNGCIEYDGEMGYPDNRCERCKQRDTPAQPPAGMVERMVEKYAEVVKQPHLSSEYGTMSCTAAMAAAAAVAHPEWFAKVCPKCNRPFDGGE
jgi:hypothetical protein